MHSTLYRKVGLKCTVVGHVRVGQCNKKSETSVYSAKMLKDVGIEAKV